MKNIESEKVRMQNLEEGMRIAFPRIQTEIRPLINERQSAFRKRILRLDAVADEIGVGKFNREWFDQYMSDEIFELLSDYEFKDEELKTLYQKYSGEVIDKNIIKNQYTEIAEMFREQIGIEIDPEELAEKGIEEYFKDNAETLRQQAEEYNEKLTEEERLRQEIADKKKTAKQLNAEAKRAEEEKLLEQDAKSIYMRLIKKYHPDLEQNEELKQEKTLIVQSVTKAYQENDFLGLLKLQVELLEEGETDASSLAEDMLARYNKILQKQLNEIQTQIMQIKMSSDDLMENFFDSNMKFNEKKFKKYKKEIQDDIINIEDELRDSYKRTKGWFKEWMKIIKDSVQESIFMNVFSSMFK
ncbi:MAG: hypothetical protein MUF45_09450 [Spirosomaceae bacterium]|nr:hypothetical protein [Spirosomataceae bacterium]